MKLVLRFLQFAALAVSALACSGAGRHRDPCGGTRCRGNSASSWRAGGRFNAAQSEYRVMPAYKGNYTDNDGGDLCGPFARPPRDCPGQRGRHRHHDGGQGCDLPGLRADARPGGGVLPRPICRRSPATIPTLPATCFGFRSTSRRRSSTTTRNVSRRGARREAAPSLGGNRSRGEAPARLRLTLRFRDVLAVLAQRRELLPPFTTCRLRPGQMVLAGSTPN